MEKILAGCLASSVIPRSPVTIPLNSVTRLYYLFVSMLHRLCPPQAQLRQAFAKERDACAHVVAVAVDRRLTLGGGSL